MKYHIEHVNGHYVAIDDESGEILIHGDSYGEVEKDMASYNEEPENEK